ncbi:MAG: AMP-binding protein, partial [Gammaproteobacteria bacterium]|nr:AMP-binding protein [Gammaproteobacteria bacterium]
MAVISLSRIVKFWADQKPDDVAIYHEGITITWAELEARSNRLARAYAELGVGFDDFVTIALSNSIEFFTACYATWKLGATPQPISAKLPKFERDQIIEIGEPVLVVGVAPDEHGELTTLAANFEPDSTLSDEPLEELTASSYKAMTSGGSTGRPK